MKMEKLNCKSLMIGDWVRMPFGLPEIRQIKYPSEIDDADFYEPIPLTRQILKANWCYEGVELRIRYKEDEGGYSIFENRRENGTNVFVLVAMYYDEEFSENNSARNTEIEIRYVHELQHALRLLGIEKEISICD